MVRLIGSTREQVRQAQHLLGLSTQQLWAAHIALGGKATPAQISEYLAATADLPSLDEERLVAAVNDEFTERGDDHPVQLPSDG